MDKVSAISLIAIGIILVVAAVSTVSGALEVGGMVAVGILGTASAAGLLFRAKKQL